MNDDVIEQLDTSTSTTFSLILNQIPSSSDSTNIVSYLIHNIILNPVKRRKLVTSEETFQKMQTIINQAKKKLPSFLIINEALPKKMCAQIVNENERNILMTFVKNFIFECQNIKDLIIEIMCQSEIMMQKEYINKVIKFPIVFSNCFRERESIFDSVLYYRRVFKELFEEEFFVSSQEVFVYFMDKITLNGLLGKLYCFICKQKYILILR